MGSNPKQPPQDYPTVSLREASSSTKLAPLTHFLGQSGTCPFLSLWSCNPTPSPRTPPQSNAAPGPLLRDSSPVQCCCRPPLTWLLTSQLWRFAYHLPGKHLIPGKLGSFSWLIFLHYEDLESKYLISLVPLPILSLIQCFSWLKYSIIH